MPHLKLEENGEEGTADFAALSTTLQVSFASSTDWLMEPECHGLVQTWFILSAHCAK